MYKKILIFIIISINVNAGDLTIPNIFVANSPAVAAQVNGNFSAVEVSVDDNDARIDALIAAVNQLQTDLATANATIANIQANTVLELDGYLMLSSINGYDTAEFSGINVQINDGSGNTAGIVNGLGNLTIGYNETSPDAPEFCSDPQYTDGFICIDNLHTWANNVRLGSHNLIVGQWNSYASYGGIIAGRSNIINGRYANVLGGSNNIATATYSSVSGGVGNQATGEYSSVSGGASNKATGRISSVSGGSFNKAIGGSSSVLGGYGNQATGNRSSVLGGNYNQATASGSSVSGGFENQATAYSSSVSGGFNKTAAGSYDWAAGSLWEDQ